jgi:hypothetical protein
MPQAVVGQTAGEVAGFGGGSGHGDNYPYLSVINNIICYPFIFRNSVYRKK